MALFVGGIHHWKTYNLPRDANGTPPVRYRVLKIKSACTTAGALEYEWYERTIVCDPTGMLQTVGYVYRLETLTPEEALESLHNYLRHQWLLTYGTCSGTRPDV